MNQNKTYQKAAGKSLVVQSTFGSDLMQLVKGRLTFMVVFTSVIAFVLASAFTVGWASIIMLALGGFFVAGSANILNEVLEKDYDKLMTRTMNRPVAAGRMTSSHAVLIAGLFALFGLTILSFFNPLTGLLGALSLVLYAFVYTPLKRYSPIAVTIGAIPGALPMLIGCVAFDGYISILALILFGIQFLWQYPHFWAIGFLSFDEYKKAEYNFIPGIEQGAPSKSMSRQAIVTSVLLLALSIYAVGVLEISALAAGMLVVLNALFIAASINYNIKFDRTSALRLMFASLLYLPLILCVLCIDKYL